jgi:hypothetical protein
MTRAMTGRYILDGKTPVPCDDLMEWARWLETADRHVAKTTVGQFWISTVFLGLDHRMGDDGPPLLFETMVFDRWTEEGRRGGEADFGFARDATWDEAAASHASAVGEARRRLI